LLVQICCHGDKEKESFEIVQNISHTFIRDKTLKKRGKRRSEGQRIGEIGESVFCIWATKNLLVPQKAKPDYGIDFFCQVMNPVTRSVEECTGAVIATQVRGITGNARRRIVMDRTDVESALRSDTPYCLIAVDTSLQKVYHLFLDETLLREFHSFLEENSETKSIPLNRFSTGSEDFRKSLMSVATPAYQNRIRLVKTELNISSDIPGTKIRIIQSSRSNSAVVSVPWITQIFEIEPDKREEIFTIVFEDGSFPLVDTRRLKLRESLATVQPLVDGPIFIRGTFEQEVELFVRLKQTYRTEPFLLRRLDDKRAYIHRSGLILIVSDRRLDDVDGLYKHFMEIKITRSFAISLGKSSDMLEFLRTLSQGAIINEVGKSGIPVESWSGLERVGPFVVAVQKVYDHLGINLSDVFLADVQDEEFGKTITLIEYLLDGMGIERIMPGFLLGPAAGHPPDPDRWVDVGFRIPILVNLGQRGIEIWVKGTGHVYLHEKEKLICGFRIDKQEGWSCSLNETRFNKGPNPEVVVYEDWPTIPLFRNNPDKGWSFKGPIQNPLFGEIWPISSE